MEIQVLLHVIKIIYKQQQKASPAAGTTQLML
jgi:hypothetical protein